MTWQLSYRADPLAKALADRHYNRQNPDSPQFVPPGRCLVLRAPRAFWVTSWPYAQYVRHAWAGAWVCSAFRVEHGDAREASAMILEAVAATVWRWPTAPSVFAWRIRRRHDRSDIEPIRVAMVTMVDPEKTRRKRDPGRCFRRAGFVEIGRSKDLGLTVLGLSLDALPAPSIPVNAQGALFGDCDVN